jgi:2-keto-myo-inositol isomerase
VGSGRRPVSPLGGAVADGKLLSMKLCLNTSTLRGQALDLPQLIDVCAATGYQGIEPWVRELDAWQAGGGHLAEIRARCADAGLAIPDLIGFFAWGVDDAEARALALVEARRCFEMAAALGCSLLATPPMGIKDVTGMRLEDLVARYRAVAAIGAEYGVTACLEFWGIAKTLGRLGEALAIVAESDIADACLLADVFHMYKSGSPHSGLRHAGPGTIGMVHVNDYPAEPSRAHISDADRVYPGDGIADWSVILGALRTIGYDGFLSVELFHPGYWQQDAELVARTAAEKMQALLAQPAL